MAGRHDSPLPRAATILIGALLLVPAFAFVEALEIIDRRQLAGQPASPGVIFGRLLLPWTLLALCAPLAYPLVARFPFGNGRQVRALLAHIVGLAVLPFVHLGLMAVLYSAVWGGSITERFNWLFATVYRADVLTFAGLAATLHAIRSSRQRRRAVDESADLRTQLTGARLTALEQQLHPHFFFNALNSVAALVRTGQTDPAVDALAQLSQLIRETLRAREHDDVSLREEFALLDEYLAIEKLRFGERLQVRLALDPALADSRIPFLLLQPLAENAVRHGVSGRPGPSAIEIRAVAANEWIQVMIEERGGRRGSGAEGEGLGLGLAATRERLLAYYGPGADLHLVIDPTGRGSRASLSFPVRRPRPG